MSNQTQKLHTYMARLGIASRRKTEELIGKGLVSVNNKPAFVGQRIDPKKDKIYFKNKLINKNYSKQVYILLDKPVGVLSTTSDEKGRLNILDIIPKQSARVYPVGRLDQDSEGLMLLTNDGKLAYKFTHPKFEIPKTYEVLIQGAPSNSVLNRLKRGIRLKEGMTKPAEVAILKHEKGNTWLEVMIKEGKNRQIRRMMGAIGHPVLRLKRIAMGPININMLEGKRFVKIDKPQL